MHPKVLALTVKTNRTWPCIPHPRTIHSLLEIVLPVYSSSLQWPHVCTFGKRSLYLEAMQSIFLQPRFRELVLLIWYDEQPVGLSEYAFYTFHIYVRCLDTLYGECIRLRGLSTTYPRNHYPSTLPRLPTKAIVFTFIMGIARCMLPAFICNHIHLNFEF